MVATQQNTKDYEKKDMTKVKCFKSGEKGHISKTCPKRNPNDSKSKVNIMLEPEDPAYLFVTYTDSSEALSDPWMIMLNSGANKNVIVNPYPTELEGIRLMDKMANVSGIGGSLNIQAVGHLPGIGEVYFADHGVVPGNILAFDIMDRADMSVSSDIFTARFQNGVEVEFRRMGKLYFADARKWFPEKWTNRNAKVMVTTVNARKIGYTHSDLKEADNATHFVVRLGYPSERRVLENVQWFNNANLTRHGIQIFYDIYGKPVAYLMSKKSRKPVKSVQFDDSDQQIASFDVPTNVELCVDF